MTLDDFVTRLREDILDDTVEPYRWSEDVLIRYANDAEREACRRAAILVDSSTANVTLINVTAGVQTYNLHPSIRYILSARNETDDYPMYQVSKVSVDANIANWTETESDTPKWFFIDENDIITIIPKPHKDFDMRLTVVRMPLESKEGQSEFEIPEKYQEGLLFWAAYLAFSLDDVNTKNKNQADKYERLFTQWFGPRKPILSEINKRRTPRLQSMQPMAKRFGMP